MTLTPVLVGIPDVSVFQVPVDDSYPREWLIFRLCFDGSIDAHAVHNLAWAKRAVADGRMRGFTGYMVPLSGYDSNARCLAALDQLGFPTDQVVNIDGEAWGGSSYEVRGDHSKQFNDLAEAVRARQGGRDDRVWAYGNRGPDLTVWPNKAPWLGWKVAAYTSSDWPDPPLPDNCIGWQYQNDMSIYDNPNRPHSTPPFGRCDHNMLFKLPSEATDDMPLTADDIGKIWDNPLTDGDTTQAASAWVKQGRNLAEDSKGLAQDAKQGVAAVKKELDTVKAAVIALAAAVAKLSAPVPPNVDTVALAKALVDHLDIVQK